MEPAQDISLVIGGFVLLFVGAWVFTVAMISLMGGWHRLAAQFRTRSEGHGERTRFASLAIGTGLFPARYRRVLTVTVNPSGMHLSVMFLFRLLHPPLFIPWPAVESVQRERSWLVHHVAVKVRGFEKRLFFRGAAGKKILEAFNVNTGVT